MPVNKLITKIIFQTKNHSKHRHMGIGFPDNHFIDLNFYHHCIAISLPLQEEGYPNLPAFVLMAVIFGKGDHLCKKHNLHHAIKTCDPDLYLHRRISLHLLYSYRSHCLIFILQQDDQVSCQYRRQRAPGIQTCVMYDMY